MALIGERHFSYACKPLFDGSSSDELDVLLAMRLKMTLQTRQDARFACVELPIEVFREP